MSCIDQRWILFVAFSILLSPGCQPSTETIQLSYGRHQTFKFRHADINVLGSFSETAKAAVYQLNDGRMTPFYIKGMDPDKDRVSKNRLFQEGDFNIEIPTDSEDLRPNTNELMITITNSTDQKHRQKIYFEWDPAPVPLPLDLSDLSPYSEIQKIGQVVNGTFEIDPQENVIRTSEPVARDALLLLGSPHGSQEASYSVMFGGSSGNFLGLADFFAGHEAAVPGIGIKPGWSSAGLATIRPNQQESAQTWLAWGDLLKDERIWVVKTDPPRPFAYEVGREYRVRQQVLFEDGINRARFRIWPAGEAEPSTWLCEESDTNIPDSKTKFENGSFGLFQFGGQPTQWFNIKLVSLE